MDARAVFIYSSSAATPSSIEDHKATMVLGQWYCRAVLRNQEDPCCRANLIRSHSSANPASSSRTRSVTPNPCGLKVRTLFRWKAAIMVGYSHKAARNWSDYAP